MRMLSFDVGIKNLAYCVLEVTAEVPLYIVEWNTINLFEDVSEPTNVKKITIEEIATRLLSMLQVLFTDHTYDYVLIENQPVQKNPTMKSVQMMIYSFFMLQRLSLDSLCEVRFINAGNKVKLLRNLPETPEISELKKIATPYKRNKKLAVVIARYYLAGMEQPTMTEKLRQTSKQDDLCDSFLQAVYFVETIKR